MRLIIGNKRYSSWSFRPWFLMKMSGIPFKETRIWIRKPDSYAKIRRYSPGGRVPALLDGPITVWESLAICEYLAEKFPKKNLWPKDTKARAVARSISHEMHAGFQAMRSHLPCHFIARYRNFTVPQEAKDDIARIQEIWNDCRKRYGKAGPFLFGRFSIADAMYAPVVFRFLAYGVKTDRTSRVYMNTIESLSVSGEWVRDARREKLVIPAYDKSGKDVFGRKR
jgi:glutathione S-transferase